MKETFERWVIRHKPTGWYMPEAPRRTGYTWTEPQDMSGVGNPFAPRMFGTKRAARCALTWWLQGITTKTYYRGDGWETDDDEIWETHMPEIDEEGWRVERKAEDMEVIPVDIVCYIGNK